MKLYFFILLSLFTISCSKEVREVKNPSTGNPIEKYEVIETNGSFQKDGYYKDWFNNGQLRNDGHYKENKKDGEWKSYYENGQQAFQGSYKNDISEGSYLSWYDNGQKLEEGEISNGQKIKTWHSWYPNGQMNTEETYEKGILQGPRTVWHETGSKLIEGVMKDGKRNGAWTAWNSDGQLYRIFKYDNGRDLTMVGKWSVVDSKGHEFEVEYSPDGSFTSNYGGKIERTTYQLKDKEILVGVLLHQLLKLTESEYLIQRHNYTGLETYTAKRIQ